MEYSQIIKIPKNKAKELQKFLDGEGDGTLNAVEVFTADFGDKGEGRIEVDVKVCDGEKPFVDVVMFQDGNEVGCLECSDTLLGEYPFTSVMKDSYTVLVEME